MALAYSRVTAQGQISVPAIVRRKLGIGPGSVLEWDEDGENVVVKRSARFTSEDICQALFHGRAPKARTLDELKSGIRRHIRGRYARC
jgi:antitoxin PrlF